MSEQLRTEPRQVGWLALLAYAPLGLAAFLAGDGTRRGVAAVALVLVVAAALGLVLLAMLLRRSVRVARGQLLIRHSLYTLRQPLDRLDSLDVTCLPSMQHAGLLARTNGVAAFGYYSGWFLMERGLRAFCAVSAGPVYRLEFRGGQARRVVFLSCSAAMADTIRRSAP